jgi:hypothetical protein
MRKMMQMMKKREGKGNKEKIMKRERMRNMDKIPKKIKAEEIRTLI